MIFAASPAIVGHRGYGAGQPGGYRENSLESFLAAAGSGLRWVELDARRTADDELVLWHDPVTPAGQFIVARTAEQVAAEGIIRLEDVLTALPPQVGVDIDVKCVLEDATDPVPRRTHALVLAMLREYRETRPLLVSSFDPSLVAFLLQRRGELGDAMAFGLITESFFSAEVALSAAANLGAGAVCVHTGTLGLHRTEVSAADRPAAAIIAAAHRAGLTVMAWSPTPPEAAELAAAGIDAVCVNDVPGAQTVLAG